MARKSEIEARALALFEAEISTPLSALPDDVLRSAAIGVLRDAGVPLVGAPATIERLLNTEVLLSREALRQLEQWSAAKSPTPGRPRRDFAVMVIRAAAFWRVNRSTGRCSAREIARQAATKLRGPTAEQIRKAERAFRRSFRHLAEHLELPLDRGLELAAVAIQLGRECLDRAERELGLNEPESAGFFGPKTRRTIGDR